MPFLGLTGEWSVSLAVEGLEFEKKNVPLSSCQFLDVVSLMIIGVYDSGEGGDSEIPDESKTQAVKDEKKTQKFERSQHKNPADSQEKEAVFTTSFYLTPSE